MLGPIYELRSRGRWAEYNSTLACSAVSGFVENLPGGKADYYTGIRIMYEYLYRRMCDAVEGGIFLDKTPRYYYIAKELTEIFPSAKFIYLKRNPLAVLNSIYETWLKANRRGIADYFGDLFIAPEMITNAETSFSVGSLSINYESLTINPVETAKKICDFLDVSYHKDMIDYRADSERKWKHGDQSTVYQYGKAEPSHNDKWMLNIYDAQRWRDLSEYLDLLGPGLVAEMGYCFDHLRCSLDTERPSRLKLLRTRSFKNIFRAQLEEFHKGENS